MPMVIRLPSAPREYGTTWANQYTKTIEQEFQNIWNDIARLDQYVLPAYTTAEKVTLTNIQTGSIIFDTTLQKMCVYTNGGWETVTSAP